MIDINNYKKDRTICKTCYNKNKRRNNNNTSPPNIENFNNKTKLKINNNKDNNPNVPTYENHRHVVVGPRNVGKTYYMLKKLEKIVNKRPIHIITRFPNQNPKYKTSNEIKPKKIQRISC